MTCPMQYHSTPVALLTVLFLEFLQDSFHSLRSLIFLPQKILEASEYGCEHKPQRRFKKRARNRSKSACTNFGVFSRCSKKTNYNPCRQKETRGGNRNAASCILFQGNMLIA